MFDVLLILGPILVVAGVAFFFGPPRDGAAVPARFKRITRSVLAFCALAPFPVFFLMLYGTVDAPWWPVLGAITALASVVVAMLLIALVRAVLHGRAQT